MKRQLDDYYAKFYTKEAKRFKELVANDYAKAKELAAWKEELQNFGIPLKSFHVKRRKSWLAVILKAEKNISLLMS